MEIRKRPDVDPSAGIRKYGDVEFADPVNKKYPIDTPEHVRSAWSRVQIPRNTLYYSVKELEIIRNRIIQAAGTFGVELSDETVERDAKLFTVGSYPDKGIEVTEADLDQMVIDHKPVPIKIEHIDNPLNLGVVTKLWRVGKDLLGKLTFTAPAWGLVQASGASKLSAAIKRDKSGIAEVSLVRHPRVAGAAVFGDEFIEFESDFQNGGEVMSETKSAEFSKRIADLERQVRDREVDSQIESLKRGGKLTPASECYARALLGAGESQVVTFSDGTEAAVSETFTKFLDSQPKVVEFSEFVRGDSEPVELNEGEREMCQKLGITPDAVIKHKSR